jgi:photosystem II stability/assembly factor-like uncharacterized protein
MRYLFRLFFIILATVGMTGVVSGEALARPRFDHLELKASETGPRWEVRWTSEPGRLYYVERNSGLDESGWKRVFSTVAAGALSSYLESEPYTGERIFWRLVEVDETGNPLVSEIVAAAHFDTSISAALLEVLVASGSNPVTEVVFIENGIVLGNASPGPNNTWTFSLPWGEIPAERALFAQASANNGSSAASPTYRFLLADPNHFIPLSEEGNPLYGGFISMTESGTLGAFRYYPEGLGDPGEQAGAYFSFAEGATLDSLPANRSTPTGRVAFANEQPAVRFSEATFHRYAGDPEPLVTSANGVIALENIEPQTLATAFNLSTPDITLWFADNPVVWKSGSLTETGWNGISLEPNGIPLAFPQLQQTARWVCGQNGQADYLLNQYTGSWSPLPGLTLTIPESQPLSFAILPGGEYRAAGGILATFQDGAELRGSLLWDNSQFEVSFGSNERWVSLKALRDLFPDLAGLSIPSAPDAATRTAVFQQLRASTAFALGFDTLMRKRAPLTGGPQGIIAETVNPSALNIWAERLAAYPLPSLDADSVAQIAEDCRMAARDTASSENLEAILIVLHGLYGIEAQQGFVIDSTLYTNHLRDSLLNAKEIAWARAEAIARETVLFSQPNSLELMCETLERINELDTAIVSKGKRIADTDIHDFALNFSQKINPDLYAFSEIEPIGDYPRALSVLLSRIRLLRLAQQNTNLNYADLGTPAPNDFAINKRFSIHINESFAPGMDVILLLKDFETRAKLFDLNRQLGLPKASGFASVSDFFVERFSLTTDQLLQRILQSFQLLPENSAMALLPRFLNSLLLFMESTTDSGSAAGATAIVQALEPLRDRLTSKSIDQFGSESHKSLQTLALLARMDLFLDPGSAPALFAPHATSSESAVATWTTIQLANGNANDILKGIKVLEEHHQWLARSADQQSGPAQTTLNGYAARCQLEIQRLVSFVLTSVATSYDTYIAPAYPEVASTDWALGSGIELSGIAGAARLNLTDGSLRGNLTGELHLPGMDTALTVHALSFSTDGDLQLSASGRSRLNEGTGSGPLVTIMPRRPLAIERSANGAFSISGGLRLELPDGNQIEGFINIDDPDYAIGFGFAGALTLKLAKELILIRPTIDSAAAANYTNETLIATGRFFSSFNKGLEAFAGNAPDLPALDQIQIGKAPEFEAPETALPTDLIGAWFIGAANATLHPLMQGTADVYSNSVNSIRDSLTNMDADIEAIRQKNETDLALLKRLRVLIDLDTEIAQNIQDMGSGELTGELTQLLIDNTQKKATLLREKLDALPADVDPKVGFGTARAYINSVATNAKVGGNGGPEDFTQVVVDKMKEWNTQTLSDYGLGTDGNIIDSTKFAELSFKTLNGLLEYSLDEAANRAGFGDATNLPTEVWSALATEYLTDATAALDTAVNAKDLEGMAIGCARIYHSLAVFQTLGETPPNGQDFYLQKCTTARDLIISSAGSPETGAKLADSLLEAGVRYVNVERKRGSALKRRLLGRDDSNSTANSNTPAVQSLERVTRAVPEVEPQATSEPSVFDAFWRILTLDDDGPDPQTKPLLLSIMNKVNEDAAALANDADAVEADLTGSLSRLKESAEAIALLKTKLPDAPETPELVEKFTNTWQALHIKWTPIAEAQQMHWMVTEYMEQLHTLHTQYANELGTALTDAFRSATEEAVLSLQDINDHLAALVSTIDTEEFAVKLPGDIEIQRLSGELALNRLTGSWELAFGGKLRFPDIDAFFEVPYGTIQSDGDFSLSLKSVLNAPFGLDPSFRLQVSVPAPNGQPLSGRLPFISGFDTNGQPLFQAPLLNGFSATGTLYQDLDDGTTQQWSAAIAYEHLDPGHRFSIQTASNERQPLLSDQVLIFSGGFGYSLQTDLNNSPTQTAVSVQTEMGLLLRPESETKALSERTTADYFLSFSGSAEIAFDGPNSSARLLLKQGGNLRLPSEFSMNGDTNASVALLSDIVVAVDPQSASPLSFSDGADGPVRIALNNLGFSLPVLENAEAQDVRTPATVSSFEPNTVPGFQAGVSTILKLQGTDFPVLEQISATLSFPHPSDPDNSAKRLALEFSGENWRIDGFPTSVSIGLASDLQIVDLEGFALFIESGSEFGLQKTGSGATERLILNATGNFRGLITSNLISDENNDDFAFGGGLSAAFSWDFVDAPNLQIDTLSFSGRMRLGGTGGISLGGVDSNGIPDSNQLATISFEGLSNIFAPTAENPFSVNINASLGITDFIAFGLKNTSLRFDGNPTNGEPDLIIGSLGFQQGSSFLDLLNLSELPANLTEASIALIDTSRSPETRLDLDNIVITASGYVNIELSQEANAPRLYGAVDDFQVRFPASTNGTPQFNVNSFALTLENLEIGDLGGISGGLMVGNLNQPEDLFFAGLVGATFNEVGVKAIVAARLDGLIGLCLDVNAGPLGIPLDGGALGGVLLTGATGGVSFNNTFSDPCDFKSYLSLDTSSGQPTPTPQPASGRIAASEAGPNVRDLAVIPWSELAIEKEIPVRVAETHRTTTGTTDNGTTLRTPAVSLLDCPTGDCPPATLNLLCQRHPSIGQAPGENNYNGQYADTVIFKYSSLSRTDVDAILRDFAINPESLSSEALADAFALAAKSWIGDFIPRLPGTYPDSEAANSAIDADLDAFSLTLRTVLLNAIENLSGDQSIMDGLYEAAYAGIPCQDVTIVLEGTFSWAPISTVITLSGGATASTTGTAGITGQMNLIGLPFGVGEIYYSLTDDNGQLNPSLCGFTRLGIGPLDLGGSDFSYSCEDCVSGILQALENFPTTLSDNLATAGDPILRAFIANALGVSPSAITASLDTYFGESGSLTHDQQFAVLSQLSNLPELIQFFADNPGIPSDFAIESLQALSDATLALLLDVTAALNPEIVFCSVTEPKLFGFSLTGGYPISSTRLSISKEGLAGQYSFSPSQVLGNMLTAIFAPGAAVPIAPPSDSASIGIAISAPDFSPEAIALMRNDSLAYIGDQQEHIFDNSRMTMAFGFHPFGLELFDGTGRVLLPSIDNHPSNPNRPNGRPYSRPTYPSAPEVINLAVAQNKLADIAWTGKGTELAALFSTDTGKATAAASLDLRDDYFPYGGFIGHASLKLPKPLTDAPPLDAILSLFSEDLSLQQRFDAASSLTTNYIAATAEVGYLHFYIPLPGLSEDFWNQPVDAAGFMEALSEMDLAAVSGPFNALYPFDQFFMQGEASLSFLGIPLLDAALEVDPAEGQFLIKAGIDENSWLQDIIQAQVTVVVGSPDYVAEMAPDALANPDALNIAPSERLQTVVNNLLQAGTDSEKQAALENFGAMIENTLPKAYMEVSAGLNMNPLLEGVGLNEFMKLKTAAGLYAFSPRFEPDYATLGYTGTVVYPDPVGKPTGPYTLARRNGGIVFIGSFDMGFNLNDPDPAKRLEFSVSELSVGFTGTVGSVLPAFSARATVPLINLPNVFSFNNASTSSFRLVDGFVSVNSNPPNGTGPDSDFINVSGKIAPIDLGPFLQISSTSSPDGYMGGSLRVTNSGTLPSTVLSIEPAMALLPLLGSDASDPTSLRATISGVDGGPFSFSTVSGQAWSASLEINGALRLKSPFEVYASAPLLLEAAPLTSDGVMVPFYAEVEGTGLESFELRVQIPNGVTVELFPETDYAATFTIGSAGGANSSTCLLINSDGRIYFDSGTQVIELALPVNGTVPLARVTGRLQFGFEPGGTTAIPAVSVSSVDFGTLNGGRSSTRTVSVSNTATTTSQLIMDASLSDSAQFEVTPHRHILGPGQSGDFVVRYTPDSASTHSATLNLTHNGSGSAIAIPLSGESPSQPVFHASTSSILFPDTILNQTITRAVTISNLGTDTLSISNISSSSSIFKARSDQALPITNPLLIPPGESTSILIQATPINQLSVSGELTLSTNDPENPAVSIALTVQGIPRYWYKQRDGRGAHRFADVAFFGERGYAVGPNGSLFDGWVGGRAWTRDAIDAGYRLNTVTQVSATTAYAAGSIRTTSGSTTTESTRVLRTTDGGANWSVLTQSALNRSAGTGKSAAWTGSAIIPASGYLSFVGSANGNGIISTQESPSKYATATINPELVPALNGIAYTSHSSGYGIAVGDNGTILRSTDNGKTWNQLKAPDAVSGINLNSVAANPSSNTAESFQFVVVGDNGTILYSSDLGLSWTVKSSGTTADLNGVVRSANGNWYAVGNEGTILYSSNGSLWSADSVLTSEDFTAITVSGEGTVARGQTCWATTRQGSIFHRDTSLVNTALPVLNIDEDFTDPENKQGAGEKTVRQVRFLNDGDQDATTTLNLASGNVSEFTLLSEYYLPPSGTVTLPAGQSVAYDVVFSSGYSGVKGVELDVSTSDGIFAGKNLPTSIINVGRNAYTPLGYLSVEESPFMPDRIVGQVSESAVALWNRGEAPLEFYSVEIEADTSLGRWSYDFAANATGMDATATPAFLWIRCTPLQEGRLEATVRIINSSANPVATFKTAFVATAPPKQVRLDSNVPGTVIEIDHDGNGAFTDYTLPTILTVTPHSPTNTTQIQTGTSIAVRAPNSFTVDGVGYRHQTWQPGGEREFSFTAGDSASRYEVKYARGRVAAAAAPPVPTQTPGCDFSSPDDVPFGPYVRISEASLTLPWLEGSNDSEFAIEGALFLTLQRAYGSLSSTGLVVRVPDSPGFIARNQELLEITPGAWSFDIDATGKASFLSLTPGIQILEASVLPPTLLEIGLDLRASASTRFARIGFSTLDDLNLLPGVLALGPGGFALEASLSSQAASLSFSLNGRLKMIANPLDNGNWLVDEPFDFRYTAALGFTPYTFPTSNEIASLGLFSLHSVGGVTHMGFSLNNNTINAYVNDMEVGLLGNTDRLNVDQLSLGLNASLSFEATLPTNGLNYGLFELVPLNSTLQARRVSFNIVPLAAILQVNLPAAYLNSPNDFWDDNAILLPATSIDTANFAYRFDLPTINFNGFNTTNTPKDAANFIELSRVNGAFGLRFNSQQDLFIGAMSVSLEALPDTLTGTLYGRVGLEGPSPLNLLQASISMQYNSNPSPTQANFELSQRFLGVGVRFQVGNVSPPARACTLQYSSSLPIDQWPTDECFP